MQGNLDIDEIEAVHRHIGDALAASDPDSGRPEGEQDALLARACNEACGILGRWVDAPAWREVRPTGRGPIADLIPDWERLRPFLVPLGTTLTRLGDRRSGVSELPEIGDPKAYIDRLIDQAEVTARLFRRFDRADLFKEATERIKVLRSRVCEAATGFTKETKSRARRRALTRSLLKSTQKFLLSTALILAGLTPQAVAHDIPGWGHEAVKVLFVHHAAQTAQPTMRVAPPQLGPRLG